MLLTTIVCSLTEMAADRLCDDDGIKTYIIKIKHLGDCIIGVAGDAEDLSKFIVWYQDQDSDLDMGESTALVLTKDGIFTYESEHPIKHEEEYYSIGSGAPYALSALDSGFTLKESIKAARKRDLYTGGRIDVIEL